MLICHYYRFNGFGIEITRRIAFEDLFDQLYIFVSYILSYFFIAITWINHHLIFNLVSMVNLKILWLNINLLFWLSLLPFATGWLSYSAFKGTAPIILYAIVFFLIGVAYRLLTASIVANEAKDSPLASKLKNYWKNTWTLFLNILSIFVAFLNPIISLFLLVLIIIIWLIPDNLIKKSE